MSSINSGDSIREAVISCIKATKLKDAATRDATEFKRPRDIYKKQIDEKNSRVKL